MTTDHLGSTRMVTTGNVPSRHDYLPFGEELATSNRTSANGYSDADSVEQKFTGKERDGETGMDYFPARYYSGAEGRFTIPDWSAKPQPVPYGSLTAPQTLNLYAYVGGNPLTKVDLTGHYLCVGNEGQCATIHKALDTIWQAAENEHLSPDQRERLQKVLQFYGEEKVKNGVLVKFADLDSKTAATTETHSILGFNKTTTVTFDLDKMQRDFSIPGRDEAGETAGIVGHEGQHVVDQRLAGMASGKESRTKSEENAFATQSYIMQGLGIRSAYGLWDPSWPAGEVEKDRRRRFIETRRKTSRIIKHGILMSRFLIGFLPLVTAFVHGPDLSGAQSSGAVSPPLSVDFCEIASHGKRFDKKTVMIEARVRTAVIEGGIGLFSPTNSCEGRIELDIPTDVRRHPDAHPDYQRLDRDIVEVGNIGTAGKLIIGTFVGRIAVHRGQPKLVLSFESVDNLSVKLDSN